MSKPKLLITMGCSYTEGIGCYDLETIPKDIKINRNTFAEKYSELTSEIYIKNLNRFHEFGWPNRLGKKLNYNKVLNLGLGGSSTSGQLKVFMEKYNDQKFEDFDVLLIWLLSEPCRFSFYSNGEISNKMLNLNNHNQDLENAYFNFIKDIDFDPLLEQIFYVKLMSHVCENKNWNFLTTHNNQNFNLLLEKYNPSNYYLNMDGIDIFDFDQVGGFNENTSPLCHHPNEKGYEIVAQRLYNQIKKYHSYLLKDNPPSEFKWQWNGKPKVWTKKII